MRTFFAVMGCIALIAGATFAWPHFRTAQEARAIADFKATIIKEPIFVKQIAIYRTLMKTVGPEKAEIAFTDVMPNDSVSHILNHELGRYLYETEGMGGIHKCSTALADSCYHGFISAVVLDRGIGNLQYLLNACEGGTTHDQEQQCAHGLGHGFLENVGYKDLPKALDLCAKTFSGEQGDADHCYEGVFMENNFGQFDVAPSDRWTRSSDPMYPCDEPSVLAHPGAHVYCWFMQSQSTMRGVQYPELGSVQKVVAYCDTITNADDAGICFMGLARQIQLLNDNEEEKIRAQCALLGPRADQCVWDAAQAAYIYGQRGAGGFVVCEKEPAARKDGCYETLYGAIAVSYAAQGDRDAACDSIPEVPYRTTCKAWMRSAAAERY